MLKKGALRQRNFVIRELRSKAYGDFIFQSVTSYVLALSSIMTFWIMFRIFICYALRHRYFIIREVRSKLYGGFILQSVTLNMHAFLSIMLSWIMLQNIYLSCRMLLYHHQRINIDSIFYSCTCQKSYTQPSTLDDGVLSSFFQNMSVLSQWKCGNNHQGVYPGECTLIARFMGPMWGPSGTDRNQVGPMLAPWTLLSG